jgi:hypothetical protein
MRILFENVDKWYEYLNMIHTDPSYSDCNDLFYAYLTCISQFIDEHDETWS